MKKLIALFLAAVLCFSLGACGGGTQTNSNGTQQGPENVTNKQIVAVVHIVINPEVKIRINNNGNVVDVECLNDDAKAVNEKISIAGVACEDAIVLILQETVNQGFLKDGGKIDITVSLAEEMSNETDIWNETIMDGVTQVQADNNLNIAIAFRFETMQPQKEENSDQTDPASQENPENNASHETDANGNTVIETENGVVTIDKNGNKVQEIYTAEDGTVITQNYDENGDLSQVIHAAKDGSVVVQDYNEAGNIAQEKQTFSDGAVIIYIYDADGTLSFQREDRADGSWSEYTYKNGLPVKEIGEFFDGSATIRQETEFYENGNRKSAYTYNHSDSSYSEVRYYENGIKSYEYTFIDDVQYTERSYYADGNKKTDKFVEADGTIWDLTYNPDGAHYGYTYYPDGSIWYNEWDANDVQDLGAQKQIK